MPQAERVERHALPAGPAPVTPVHATAAEPSIVAPPDSRPAPESEWRPRLVCDDPPETESAAEPAEPAAVAGASVQAPASAEPAPPIVEPAAEFPAEMGTPEVAAQASVPPPPSSDAAAESDTGPARVLFPWSQNPQRPKRVPPRPLNAAGNEPSASRPAPDVLRAAQLTPEEIAALMGLPPRGDAEAGA
jgi:nicotinate-nucleotide--dimethylbenzimidazole phosphoribosyltransferase